MFTPQVTTTNSFFMAAGMSAIFPCLPFVSEERLSAAELLDDITHQQPFLGSDICPTCHCDTINAAGNNLLAQICQMSVTHPYLFVSHPCFCACLSASTPGSLIWQSCAWPVLTWSEKNIYIFYRLNTFEWHELVVRLVDILQFYEGVYTHTYIHSYVKVAWS